jgi:probable HAF family extracellular repeat protein
MRLLYWVEVCQILLFFTNCCLAQPHFTVTDLGSLGGPTTVPYAINAQGDIVGYSTLADGTVHAFLHTGDQMVDVHPQSSGSIATGINRSGIIVGF